MNLRARRRIQLPIQYTTVDPSTPLLLVSFKRNWHQTRSHPPEMLHIRAAPSSQNLTPSHQLSLHPSDQMAQGLPYSMHRMSILLNPKNCPDKLGGKEIASQNQPCNFNVNPKMQTLVVDEINPLVEARRRDIRSLP